MERDWLPADFAGMALALADCDSDDAAVRFRAAAQAAGIPSMVIDTPAHSDFQFGAIVNRSPVVIGIRSEEHTLELQSLMRILYAVLCLKTKHLYLSSSNLHHTHYHS